jgi:hypothetical protein
VQKRGHGLLGIEHGFVHVDVDDLRAVFDLLPATASAASYSPLRISLENFGEPVTLVRSPMLTKRVRAQHQRLESAEARVALGFGENVRRQAAHRFGDGADVRGRRAAASAGDIQPAVRAKSRKSAAIDSGVSSNPPKALGSPAFGWQLMWIGARCESSSMYGRICLRAEGAVDAHAQQSMCETEIQNASTVCPESVRPLWSTMVTETMTGTRLPGLLRLYSLDGEERGLGIQRVEDGFEQQQIGAAFHQAARLFVIHFAQFVERDAARGGAVHVLRHRRGAIGRPHRSRDQSVFAGMRGFEFIGHLAGDPRARDIKLVNVILEAVIERGNRVRVECVGFDDVGAASRYCALDGLHDLRLRDVQHVEVPAQVARMLQKLRAAKSRFLQLLRLDHRAHGAVQNDDPLLQEIFQRGDS